ncbi:MAG: heme lyase CcmF/NrfE family subunit [bacterium]
MNPLLQHPAMAIHPPILYLGYVGFAIPFAFAFGALLSGQIEDRWVKTVRRWTIVPWFFLGIGILLGGKWAYMELGWGGYWAWDPVENAAFMPWLTGTAFLHSIMIQEKKSMLKIWNVVLIFLTFILSIFGTFLTRSGVVSSVHSFTESQIGPLFLSFVGLIIVVSFAVLYLKKELLKSDSRIESVVSRESAFLINNVVFVGACFAVFWGTVFPVISEAVRGIKITVGPPWFNSVNIPIFLFLLFLTGVGPLVAWRKSSTQYLKRLFLKPVIATLATVIVLVLFGIQHVYAIISFALCVFVTATIIAEFHRGARARMKNNEENYLRGLTGLFKKNKRRYGGYVVHFAIVLLFFGVTGAAFDQEVEISLGKGESVSVGRFDVIYNGFDMRKDAHKELFEANLTLMQDGRKVSTIYPQRHFYYVQEQPTTEVAVHSTFMEDFYVVLAGWEDDADKASFHFYLKPLVNWVWIGGMILALGTVITLLPGRQETRKAVVHSRPQRKRVHAE